MKCRRLIWLAGCWLGGFLPAPAQRVYAPSSVLAAGTWFTLTTGAPGVYKIDLAFLNSLGLNTGNIPSASLRLYGSGGRMLSESNNGPWSDDLTETAIRVFDGGDGQFNGPDYFLFFAPGPDAWLKDSANLRFTHQKNLYSGKSVYYLRVGGSGKRIPDAPVLSAPAITVNSFSVREFHELDSVNFLSSGKEWYGEEFSNLPGRTLTRNFRIGLPAVQAGAPVQLRVQCAARSVGGGSRFGISINNQAAGQLLINAVGGGIYDLFGQQATGLFSGTATADNSVTLSFTPGSMNAQGWLNWLEVFTRGNISLGSLSQLLFRDWASVGSNRAEFVVGTANTSTRVWDITDPQNPVNMPGTFSNNEFRFVNDCSMLREYVAFNSAAFPVPVAAGPVPNQNLHAAGSAAMLIVTPVSLLPQASRLADLHRQHDNLTVNVVTTEQVFNEFSSGIPDPTAIRDIAKMYHDKFGTAFRYLLLFGDASFDYRDRISGNSNLVPAYQNPVSLDPLSTYTSDDFFGFLDDNEDINSGLVMNLLDIGVGRIPAKTPAEATDFVNKIAAYLSPQSFGPWRNNICFVADDEDNNLHLQDAEQISGTAAATAPVFDRQKIYLDAFKQETGPGGSQYPQANQVINNQIFNGVLIWNYNGHGGPSRLAEETIADQSIVNSWNNAGRLPLFITATCDFAPYDNPIMSSLGENLLLRPATGAIALMTTTRPVFAFSNRVMNDNYIRFALQADAAGKYRSLGDAIKDAKNFTYQTLSDIANNRKFTLLGDPALTLAFPAYRVSTTQVNGIPVSQADTISATEKVVVDGEVTDIQGNRLSGFNGYAYPVVFDKPQTVNTLANDPGSQVTAFTVQSNILFRGRSAVEQGKFRFTFKVPRDINYQYGNGRLGYYATDSITDANGFFTHIIVGGNAPDNSGDREGPAIRLYLNDELFVNGGLCNQRPVLLVKLADSSGINTTGTGIGHDIVATLDNDNRQYFILNDFYQAELNSYQRGTVRFQLPELEPGTHTLRVKAWDVLNNSGEAQLEFVVAKEENIEVSHVLNYPNPFTTHTQFWFEHNKPGQWLQVQVQIMTITGRVVRTISRPLMTEGNRSADLEWDGRDDFGQKLGRGVYLYKLRVSVSGGGKKEVLGKLVIL